MKLKLMLLAVLALSVSNSAIAQQGRLCLDNVCIGDDVEQLELKWKKVPINYKTSRTVKMQLNDIPVERLFYDYNERLITDSDVLKKLAAHIIVLQKFDQEVLDTLRGVKAICTPLSLTGEVDNGTGEKLFVTFRTVADDGGRGRLRVVQLEKEYKIYPQHLRPSDKERYDELLSNLRSRFEKVYEVRDIDARAESNEIAFAEATLGFRFFSDVRNPLIFRLRDTSDYPSIEFDEGRSALCKK
ncbi:hypothetical protein [Aliikangiella sp. G2MR2-5]|uniref:hypothetical protein n=1 Tax=Aliikangiella sp. G2MR2-5 TaxID=2788943 RepID=UPI0018A96F04|nr:hypothetical protein [Aliikangiella sp. G2MR2-5]